jgi:hypothetical protein
LEVGVDLEHVDLVVDHAEEQDTAERADDDPRPPKRLTPPMTTAVIESNSSPSPTTGSPTPIRAI